MKKERIEASLGQMLEALAAIEHERWSHWQRYMHDKGKLQADGSLLIAAELVQRWERLIATPYPALTEAEKESDRASQALPSDHSRGANNLTRP
jgi:hypothetical protein